MSQPATACPTDTLADDQLFASIVAASDAGIDVNAYCALLGVGATDAEIRSAHGRLMPLDRLPTMLAGDVTLTELVDADAHRMGLDAYVAVRATGAAHRQVVHAFVTRRGFDYIAYIEVRKTGATHRQALAVVTPADRRVTAWVAYCEARVAGKGHLRARMAANATVFLQGRRNRW